MATVDRIMRFSPTLRSLYAVERRWDLWGSFCRAREHLSRRAWDQFSVDCDRGPIAKTGVLWQPISREMSDQLLKAFQQSPPEKLRRSDYCDGYFATLPEIIINFLNLVNEYRTVTPSLMSTLRNFLAEHGPQISEWVGHPWRTCSVRQFDLRPIVEPGSRHTDGWPLAIRKLFILPRGASAASGTTWFRLRDGRELLFDHPAPCFVMFENSVVEHCIMPGPGKRPTIELNLVPARETSLAPVYAGLNGWYPWFPEQSSRWHLEAALAPFNTR